MPDKQIAALYKASGTGTGTGYTTPSDITGTGTGQVPVPAGETEVVESKQALTQLLMAGGLVVVTALGQFFAAVAPDLAHVILNALPHLPFVSAQLVSGFILAIAAWMQRTAATKHKVAVVKSLVTEPSTGLKLAYKAEVRAAGNN